MTGSARTQSAAGRAPHGAGSTIGHLEAGDGLRAVAMLSVFAFHAVLDASPGGRPVSGNFDRLGIAGDAFARFDLGLSIFFVLSGYLIARPFARAFVEGRAQPSVRRYAVNRVLRIVPMWLLAVTAVMLVFGTRGDSPGEVLGVYAFAQIYTESASAFPISQGWTLDAEMAFYVSVPLMALVLQAVGRLVPAGARRAVLALLALAALTALSLHHRTYAPRDMAGLNNPVTVFWAFSPGLALALAEPWLAPFLRRDPALAGRAGLLLLATVPLAIAAYVITAPAYYVALHHTGGIQAAASAAVGGGLVAGLLALQLGGRPVPRVLGGRAMTWMGERSYSFYLLHFGVMVGLLQFAAAGASFPERVAVLVLAGFPLTLALSHLTFELVERPFLERRRSVSAGAAPPPHLRCEPDELPDGHRHLAAGGAHRPGLRDP